jgi:hypothetical protein
MKQTLKYIAAGAVGYGVHAYVKKREESKVYKPEPLDKNQDPTLTDVLSEHFVNKVSKKISSVLFPDGVSHHNKGTNYAKGHR